MAEDIQTPNRPVSKCWRNCWVTNSRAIYQDIHQEEVTGFVAKESKKAQEKIFKDLGFENFAVPRKDS